MESSACSFLLLPLVVLLLHFVSYKNLIRWFEPKSVLAGPTGSTREQQIQSLQDIDRGFRLGYKYCPVKGTCLARSIVLMAILGRKNISSHIVIGVMKDGENFGAHAWLESDYGKLGPDGWSSVLYTAIL